MNIQKLAVLISFFLFIFLLNNSKLSAQDKDQIPPPNVNTTIPNDAAKLDAQLTGEWTTTSRNANFAKIKFGSEGSFQGYTQTSDAKPFASGTYQIQNGGIAINATLEEPTMNQGDPVSMNYIFNSYTVKDKKLTILSTDNKTTIEYSKSQ